MNSTMATRGIFHKTFSPSTRSTESSLKNVTSQYSTDEEIPEVVALPVGSYMVVARSEKDGYIRLPVAIKAGQRTVLDLDLRQEGTPTRLARN
jgi:hypothetical protein